MSSLTSQKLMFQNAHSFALPSVDELLRTAFLKLLQKPDAKTHTAAHIQESASDELVPTLFHEPWWLDIVTGGDYKTVEIAEHGTILGRLHYFPKKRFGLTYSIMPPMTHFLGPTIVKQHNHAPIRDSKREEIIRELLKKLPPAALYSYKCHRDISDTIAFQQEQFITNVQFTHEIYPQPEDVLWGNLRSDKRRKIKKGYELLTLCNIEDPQEFWDFYAGNLDAKSVHNVCDKHICCSLIEGCLTRGAGKIYAARDKNNVLAAAIFCMWDKTSSYYFMSTRALNAHNTAVITLTWEAIKDAARRGLIFDFDGISSAEGVRFFQQFGGVVSPRYVVTRTSNIGLLALALKDRHRDSKYFF